MSGKIESFNAAHAKKTRKLSKEERIKATLKKLAQEMQASNNEDEPRGLASGKMNKYGEIIIDSRGDIDDD